MPRSPSEEEEYKVKFANPDYKYAHNITRLDKRIKRAWCNNCCTWVSAVENKTNGSWHCRRSYNAYLKLKKERDA